MSDASLPNVHLFAFFQGTNPDVLWAHPNAGSQIDIDGFHQFAATAERGLFDSVFLAEGLRIHESNGAIVEHSIADRPDPVTRLAGLAARTRKIGLIGTTNVTHSEPFDLARRVLTLDILSGGRAGWNLVTASDPLISANFRRGQFLAYEDRYRRAEDYLHAVHSMWASTDGQFRHRGPFLDLEGRFDPGPSPQGRPVLVQAGDSHEGRDFAAGHADVIFTEFRKREAAREFYADISQRVQSAGRAATAVKIISSTRVVLGDTYAEAVERAEYELRLRVSPALVQSYIQDAWGIDFPDLDIDAPLPSVEPRADHKPSHRITTRRKDAPKTAAGLVEVWRGIAERDGLTARGLVVTLLRERERYTVGTPATVAEEFIARVDERAGDGFVLGPTVQPSGIGEFVDKLVPELQNRGRYRTEYTGDTLRHHLSDSERSDVTGAHH